jgi:cytochrome c-type biogenesis protein CcmH
MNLLRASEMLFVSKRPGLLHSIAALVLVAILLTAFSACISEDDLTAEQRAFSLDKQLMCPVCDGQTLDQSHAQLSTDMKQVIREKIAAGDTNQEIRDYFVARYGEVVLAAPEASGFNLLVWVMPVVITGFGALTVFWVLKNMKRKSAAATTAAPAPVLADRQLDSYLAKVDADINKLRSSTTSSNTGSQESGNE